MATCVVRASVMPKQALVTCKQFQCFQGMPSQYADVSSQPELCGRLDNALRFEATQHHTQTWAIGPEYRPRGVMPTSNLVL